MHENLIDLFNKQKKTSEVNRTSSPFNRKEKLKKLLNVILDFSKEIEEAIYKDFKKPSAEVKLTEIFTVTSEIKHALKHLSGWTKAKKVKTPINLFGTSSRVIYEPKGVSLIISPWNFPFQLAIGPLISAVAAGNCVILKPSELSPHTSKVIKKVIDSVFDESEAAVILGGKEVSQELLSLPFDHIFFTGSTYVGKKVMEAAARNLTSVTLELGGKSPVIIHKSADIRTTAERITWGKFINAGQTCIAPDYLLVPESIKNDLVNGIKKQVIKFYGSIDEIIDNKDYSRIINKSHFYRLLNILDKTVKEGGKLEIGGITNERDNFIQPTIISNVKINHSVMQEEIFGPILPIITYKNEVDLYEIINENPRPLALYIFSSNKSFTEKIIQKIPAGGTAINDTIIHFVNPNLPFGGVKFSGIGKSHGFYGFKEFSNERSILKQRKLSLLRMFYPPYTNKVLKMIDLTIKYM